VKQMKAKKNVRGLIKALGYQKDARVGQAASFALGEIGDPRAVKPLIAVLKDHKEDVRKAAAIALGKIGDPRAVEPLIAVLKEIEGVVFRGVCRAAAEALGEIGDPRAVEPLIAALKDKDEYVRKAAAIALGEIGDPRAVEPLTNALQYGGPELRKAAAEALDKLGWLPDEGANGAAYWVVKNEWARCVKIGEPALVPLTAALKDLKEDVRRAAARALGEIGESKAVESLAAALNDEDSNVRLAIADALGKLSDPCALVPLISLLKDSNWHIRRTAANALVQLYKYDLLNNEQQNRLLSERPAIIDKHVDEMSWGPHDCAGHTDTGIGVSFPV
jgi:HEAT repeat protein